MFFKSKKQLSESSAFVQVSDKLPECCQMRFPEKDWQDKMYQVHQSKVIWTQKFPLLASVV